MSDHIIRAIAPGIRIVAAITTEIAEEARKRHNCSPVATAALGRVMTAALLLSETIKGDESITIRVAGNGPLGNVVADTPERHCVRGYIHNPTVDLPAVNGKLAVGEGVGKGLLHVTRFNPQREVFTGTVEMVSGEIAEDITRYLLESEQIPSTVGLGVLVGTDGQVTGAGGFLVQAMPDATDDMITNIEQNLSLVASPSHLAMEGVTAAGMVRLLLAGLTGETVYEPEPVAFQCTCNRERVANMLNSLGRDEMNAMMEEGQAEVRCNFCNELYQFTEKELCELQNRNNGENQL
ncbi:MAG: Hsp33 family molecular chaperone HslO [Negativicutes bacterium]